MANLGHWSLGGGDVWAGYRSGWLAQLVMQQPLQHEFINLNIAVGGIWGRSGGGIDDDIFPQRMEIDYVRVYKQEE